MRVPRQASVAVLMMAALAGCGASHQATPSSSPVVAASHAPKTMPPGVPAPVFRAAAGTLDNPANRITAPVQWIETTFGAFERAAASTTGTMHGTAAAERTPVYVVQVQGSFAFTGSWTGGGSHPPGPYTVNGMVLPIGKAVPGTTAGYETNTAIDLSKIAPVHTFAMP
jgi:hypothetical protein